MKFLVRIVSAVLLSLCFSQAVDAAQSAAPAGGMFPEVVARVNDHPISGRDLDAIMRRELASIGNPEWNSLRAEYRAELLYAGVTSLINSRLIYERAIAEGSRATAAEVDEEMQSIAKNYSNDAEMNAALARQFLDRDSLRRSLEQELTMTKYLNSLTQSITITPEEVSRYYAENPAMFAHPDLVRASHILLLSDETPDLDAKVKERAENLLTRARGGEDFARLARENSVDSTASEGGDIGYVTKEMFDPSFADAVFSMSVGEIRLIRSRFGHHVIKLTDKKSEGVAPLDEIREDLVEIIRREKIQTELMNLLGQLQEKANIEILVSPGE